MGKTAVLDGSIVLLVRIVRDRGSIVRIIIGLLTLTELFKLFMLTLDMYTGRKPIEIDWTKFGLLYGEWKSKNITGRDFMRRMGLSANTFYRRVREYESEHGIAELTSA